MPPETWAEAVKLRPLCWGLAYRMTGTAQDADEVAQDAFVRLAERPPADASRPIRPWLVAVTLNLSRDRLRQRRRRAYVGPWLPSPVPDARLAEDRLGDTQAASWAFLRAAEALTPTQRAVFLAREVLELSSAETAAALGTSPASVDVMLHRARKALGDLPAAPSVRDDGVVLAFLACLRLGMPGAAARLLAPDAVAINDGGGHVNAARRPVVGARKIVTFFRRLARLYPPDVRWSATRCNGLLTVLGELPAS
ncbi:MAG: sigma-70 family RNA polymerase sigma factor, partial [Myxococcota bacterium]